MRLAALGLMHEANTFAPSTVSYADFEAAGILRGPEIPAVHGNASTTMAGYLTIPDVVPLLFTTVTPSGVIEETALEPIVDEAMEMLADQGPWDGVLLALHGAAVAEHRPDVDGYWLARTRAVVGPDVPIGVALDLHANISAEMARHADILATYRTNPHVDARDRATEVGELMVRTVRGEVRPRLAFAPIPAVINILRQHTAVPPMSDILADVESVLGSPGVLAASVAEGYPYADVPEMGMSAVVVCDGDEALARQHVDWLAARTWERRADFAGDALPVDDALHAAVTADAPVLLLDVGDNIGGGTAGNSVVVLEAAIRLGVGSLVTIVNDAAAAAECHQSGENALVRLTIGDPPLSVTATVRRLLDGRFEATGPTHAGQRHFDTGPTAVLHLESGQTVVLTSRTIIPSSPSQLTALGLDPASYQVIVAKGVQSPLAGYAPVVTDVIRVDTPGVTAANLDLLTYRHRRQPLFPFEPAL